MVGERPLRSLVNLVYYSELRIGNKENLIYTLNAKRVMQVCVCKQMTFCWYAAIELDNNDDVLMDFRPVITIYTLPHA